MKKILLLLIVCVLIGLNSIEVFAAGGCVKIHLPENMAGETVLYGKENEPKKKAIAPENGIVHLSNLEEGIYEIEIVENEQYEFTPVSVSVPTWSEEEERMLYEIDVFPKYVRKKQAPATGDNLGQNKYIYLAAISLIIVAIMSCHNRFKCGRIFGKYSKKRRI